MCTTLEQQVQFDQSVHADYQLSERLSYILPYETECGPPFMPRQMAMMTDHGDSLNSVILAMKWATK